MPVNSATSQETEASTPKDSLETSIRGRRIIPNRSDTVWNDNMDYFEV